MQFEFRDRSLQAKQKPAIGSARVVNPVTIRDQAATVTADIKKRIPVRAIASQPRHLDRQDEADFPKGDTGNQFLEAATVRRGGAAHAEIGIDDVDIGFMPPEVVGALAERVLQPQALLIVDHLMWARLTNVDDRFAAQMARRDEIRAHRSPSRALSRDRRRSPAGVRPAACARRSEPQQACVLACFGYRNQILQCFDAEPGAHGARLFKPPDIHGPQGQEQR